jgi:NTE family protein
VLCQTRPVRERSHQPTLFAWLLVVALMLGGCSSTHYTINDRAETLRPDSGYRMQRVFAQDAGDRMYMQVSVSGGGARAAALGFGVLEALRDTPIVFEGKPQRLIDQMDLVMGVSGGSLIAAYYTLKGPDGFADFESKFLNARLQSDLLWRLGSPRSLWRLGSSRFGRSDLLQEVLDERLFKGATFGTLAQAARKPFMILYATDMVSGTRFEFIQEQFDYLCSDLASLPIARAVAASSAAPLVLSPVALWNYAPAGGTAGCGEPSLRALVGALPGALPGAQEAGRTSRRMAELDALRNANAQGPQRPYIHLVDGGLSDNVSARGPLDFFDQFGSVIAGARSAGYRGVKHTVFIFVNAETSARSPEDRSANVPGTLRAALALADIPINRNSDSTLTQMRGTIEAWAAEVRAAHARGDTEVFAADAQFYLIEVTLAAEPDAEKREALQRIPTSLELPADDVALLRAHARAALQRSGEFQRLLRALR